jgi:hypothetical protein
VGGWEEVTWPWVFPGASEVGMLGFFSPQLLSPKGSTASVHGRLPHNESQD